MHIKVMHDPVFFVVYSRMCIGFADAPRPDSAGLSVAAGRNSKACGNLLKAFVEIHNSLRSDNGFPLIAQISASQEFLPCLHMTPDWNRDGVLVYDSNPLCDCVQIIPLQRSEFSRVHYFPQIDPWYRFRRKTGAVLLSSGS